MVLSVARGRREEWIDEVIQVCPHVAPERVCLLTEPTCKLMVFHISYFEDTVHGAYRYLNSTVSPVAYMYMYIHNGGH